MTTKNGSRVQPSPLPSAGGTKVPVRLFRPTPKPKVEGPRSSTAARLGPQVRALRLAAGVSLAALAGVSGVSRSMLSRIERGRKKSWHCSTGSPKRSAFQFRASSSISRGVPTAPSCLQDVASRSTVRV